MPIEFRCPSCNQQLRVPDAAGGKNAKCPKCATILAVPASNSAASPPAPFGPPPQPSFNPPPPPLPQQQPNFNFGSPPPQQSGLNFGPPPPPPGGSFGAPPPSSPFGDFSNQPSNPFALKPVGGAPQVNPFAAPQGGYHSGRPGHQIVEVGAVLNYSLKVWQDNLGIGVAIVVVHFGVILGFWALMGGGMLLAAAAKTPELFIVIFVIMIPLMMIVGTYLGIGQAKAFLKLVRGQPTTLGDLFDVGDRFWPMLGFSLLATFAVMIAAPTLVGPYILLLFFWPSQFLVLDRKCGVMDSFGRAYQITEGNRMTAFLLALCAFGFALLGEMACLVGLLFAAPLISIMWTTAYLMMTGEIPIQPKMQYGQQQPMYR